MFGWIKKLFSMGGDAEMAPTKTRERKVAPVKKVKAKIKTKAAKSVKRDNRNKF